MPLNTPFVGYQTPSIARVLYLQAGSGISLTQDLVNGNLTIAASGGGAVTGSGAAGQVSFWTGASVLSGDNGLFWDNTNKFLGIGTAAPGSPLDVRGLVTVSSDIQWGNDTGFGLLSFVGGKRFVAYTSAAGLILGSAVNVTTLASTTTSVSGTIQFPVSVVFIANGTISKHASNGLMIAGVAGSVFDFALTNPSGATGILIVPTGTVNAQFGGNVGIGVTPSASILLDVEGSPASNPAGYFKNSAAAGTSLGLLVDGGGNASDYSFRARDRAGTILFTINGAGTVNIVKLIGIYNNITTVGQGVPAIYARGRLTGQTGIGTITSFTPTADSSFLVTINVNVTAYTSGSITSLVNYTDETNSPRNTNLALIGSSGAYGTAANSAQPWSGVPLQIRVKSGTTVSISINGSFTATYNVEAFIIQIA